MKKLKIKKCMTSFLMLAVMVVSIIGVMPKTTAYASDGQYIVKQYYNFTTEETKGIYNTYSYQPHIGDVKTYCAYNSSTGRYNIFFVSKNTFGVDVKKTDYKGNITSNSISSSSCLTCMPSLEQGVMNYHCFGFEQYSVGSDFAYRFSSNLGRTLVYTDDLSEEDLLMIILGGKTNNSCYWLDSGDTDGGTADNPIEDEEIGHLILTGQKGQDVLPENRDTDAVSSYQVFKWKSKTDTGFSLTKNKYAQTRIEAKVESRCVIYKHMNSYYVKNNFTSKKIEEDNEVKEKFKNFGESATLSKIIPADTLEYVLSFDKIDKLLPKTAKEWHNDLYVGHNYRVYFRVLCTDSLTVIPDENDNSWHSGGWSYVDFSLDGVVSGNGNGHFNENGEWVTDDKKDDINNGGRDTFIDDDAAKDDRDNSSDWGRKDTNSDSGLDTSSIKGFMNQVGNVPKAIGKLFTFLPDWVTTFIAFGFVLLIALMIIKAIRG